ncbi:MAG: Multi-sensor signal transduction histidine kinase [Candidatus Gallionella acididurans]|uniref:Virulence sensor protein BvgS n=1 Tax=Candidatus Gallionella acididurans TaxID=1796491 RepID=A0A139BY52_9PROT|nr:MAG: Multi-sensor signal transduction histidine kinase [Candidatus Gallionella acididurans]
MKSKHADDQPSNGADRELRQAEDALYRTLFEHAPVGVLVADTGSRYLDANPSICRMLGYARDELIGMHASDILVRSGTQHIMPALNDTKIHSGCSHEWQFRRKDGSVFSVEVTATTMPDGNLLAMVRDISASKPADMAAAWLAAIVESSGDAIIGKDLNGIVTSWNSGAEKIFGYSAREMVGTSILRLFPADRQHEEKHILGKIWRGEKVEHLETLRLTKDKRLVDVLITTSPIRDAAGNIIGASKIARDITALKAREREIARMSRLYAALSQINQAIVWTKTRDELFQNICRVLIEHGGFQMAWIGWHDPATQLLMPVAVCGDESGYIRSIRIYTDDRPEAQGPSGTAFRTGRPYICNDMLNDPATLPWRAEIVRRSFRASAVFPVRQNDRVCGTLTVYADQQDFFQDEEIALLAEAAGDVSFALDNLARDEERRQAEMAAQSERQFSDTMIESMPGILYFYNEQGQFLRWNKNFEIVSGYSGAEIACMHPLDIFSGEEKHALERRIAEVFETGESFIEASLIARDGKATPYFFTGRRVVFNGMTCLVGMGIDISERKQAETALRELNETLEQKVTERTGELQAALVRARAADEIKSAFLATMSHELRTPLNSIIGFTGIILQGLAGPLGAEQTKQLGMVQGSARHLLDLINDVLDISKIEAGQLEVRAEPFDLRVSLERVIALVRPMAEKKHLALDAVIHAGPFNVVSDRRRVEQILLNLLNNAIKFTEHGGVTVTAGLIDGFRAQPDLPPRPAVRLQVSDTGIGIKPDELATLFQPFRQLDAGLTRQHEGTGLGLAICRRLAVLLQGEITVNSIWSKGSEFTLTIPLQLPSRS